MQNEIMRKVIGHYKTITNHRRLVRQGCFAVGLYRQGLLHDLSKFSPTEFIPSCKYYEEGKRSPNVAEREAAGRSLAWMHHKGRNKHHLEYWIDYPVDKKEGFPMVGVRMPVNYVVEMFCDRVAACKNYQGEEYTTKSPLAYYEQGRAKLLLHKKTAKQLEILLRMLAEHGEEYTNDYIRRKVLRNR